MITKYKTTPFEMINSLLNNLELIFALIKRDISSRYQSSFLGIIWSFLNPIFLLAVYTLIFSVVFKVKWTGGGDNKVEFVLMLFAGLIVFNVFSECVNRSPATVLQNSNYVKKVIFPLEILSWVNLGASLFHAFISFIVWVLFYIIMIGLPHITLLLVPLILIPLCFLVLGVSWLFAALGVYLRDVSQVVTLVTTVIMFLSPIFYPVEALPQDYQGYLKINPLSLSISQIRDVLYWGEIPDFSEYIIYVAVCFFIAWLGFFCFQKMRKGFADVL